MNAWAWTRVPSSPDTDEMRGVLAGLMTVGGDRASVVDALASHPLRQAMRRRSRLDAIRRHERQGQETPMEWSDLRVFLAIAREGTLAAAARANCQSQPTMGRRLRALEQDVGQTLFQRTSDGFVLTNEGAAVLAHAERMEEEARALEREMAGQDHQFDGMLRISSSDWFGSLVLTPVMAEFAKMQPHVVVEIITSSRHHSLARREADIVFKNRPFDEPEAVSRRLMHMPYAVYVKVGSVHPCAGDGTGTPLVTMDIAHDLADAVWLKRMLPRSRIVSRSNDRDVQGRMCALGAGAAVLPQWLGDSLPGSGAN
jgi:DNA-binding transcriptional LysR family regulator